MNDKANENQKVLSDKTRRELDKMYKDLEDKQKWFFPKQPK